MDYTAVVSSPAPGYGTNVWWSDQDAITWTARYAELQPSVVRLSLSHSIFEPVNDDVDPSHINWNGFLFDSAMTLPNADGRTYTAREQLSVLRDQGVSVLIHFAYLAPWLSANGDITYPPSDLVEYGEFMTATLRYLLETLQFPPEHILVEAMNEPDLGCNVDPVTPCFWRAWNMNDLANVVRITHQAIEAVDPRVRLVGVAECCGTSVVRNLLDNYPEGKSLDGLSFHYYSPSGYDLSTALSRAAALAPYGLPIYIDEYGSVRYRSVGNDGGLWHSWALPVLWEAGLAPIQYAISEIPNLGEPYNSMGLFSNWQEGWSTKPSYWVYANFFHRMGRSDVVSSTAPSSLDVMAGRWVGVEEAPLSIWITNRENTAYDTTIQVNNFPTSRVVVDWYDNLNGLAPVDSWLESGSPLIFTVHVPAQSSRSLLLYRQTHTKTYLPVILRQVR